MERLLIAILVILAFVIAVALLPKKLSLTEHPEYTEHSYFVAVETAFKKWEAMQNVGR